MIRADGAARGNPGPAAAGAVIIDASTPDPYAPDASPVGVVARTLGIQTNNYAEYTAVALALEKARSLGAREVELVLDSQLVVEQLSGRWKVKHPQIKPLVERVRTLLAEFDNWSIRHERRASNLAADALANLALDDAAAAASAERGGARAVAREPQREPQREPPEPAGTAVVAAAVAIFDAAGRILLVRHTYGKLNWELPGGLSFPSEPPSMAAERELEEETGIGVNGGELSGVYFEPHHFLGPAVHFVFRYAPPAEAQPVARPPEIGDVGWFALDDLPRPISDFTEIRARDAVRRDVAYRVIQTRRWHE